MSRTVLRTLLGTRLFYLLTYHFLLPARALGLICLHLLQLLLYPTLRPPLILVWILLLQIFTSRPKRHRCNSFHIFLYKYFFFICAMRIRKGHRCLPLPHANRSSLHGVLDDARDDANQALLNLVTLADNLIDGSQNVQKHEKDRSTERKKFPEREPEENRHILIHVKLSRQYISPEKRTVINLIGLHEPVSLTYGHGLLDGRVSADDDFNYRSSLCNAGSNGGLAGAKSVFSMRKLFGTTGTTSSNPSTSEIQHKTDLLEQSLCHICSRAGMTGFSVRDAVFQMIEQGLPGLSGVGERLVEQVAQSFRNSSKFVECKERGTYCLQHLPADKEKKLLVKGDSVSHHEKTVSSSDMLGAAKQLQYLRKSCSNSLGFGVIEPIETSSVRDSKRKVVQNNPYVRQSKVATVHKDIKVRTRNSISSASRSLNLKQMDQFVTLCTRDDGKGWKCPRPAQVGFAMCTYHRDLINQGKERRMRVRLEAGPNPQFRYVANARVMKNAIMTETSWSPFSDDELSYDEHRQFVKAKTITSLLLKSDVRPRH